MARGDRVLDRQGCPGHDPLPARAAPAEGRSPAQDLVEDRPQGIHIAVGAELIDLAAGLLGRHVGRGAEDVPVLGAAAAGGDRGQVPRGGGHPLAPVAVVVLRGDLGGGGVRLAQGARQTPVDHQDLAEASDHEVARLEVAVDDALGVGIGDRLAGARQGVDEAAEAPAVLAAPPLPLPGDLVDLADDLGQREAIDLSHGEPQAPVGQLALVVQGDDAGVLEAAGEARLAQEALALVRALRHLPAHDLHGERALQVGVPDPLDHPHRAAADAALVGIALAEVRRGVHLAPVDGAGVAGEIDGPAQHELDPLGDGLHAGVGPPVAVGDLAKRVVDALRLSHGSSPGRPQRALLRPCAAGGTDPAQTAPTPDSVIRGRSGQSADPPAGSGSWRESDRHSLQRCGSPRLASSATGAAVHPAA